MLQVVSQRVDQLTVVIVWTETSEREQASLALLRTSRTKHHDHQYTYH